MLDFDQINEDAIVSLTWYSKHEHRKLLRKAPDSHELIQDYQQWLAHMRETKRLAIAKGAIVVRVPITVDAMLLWCRRNGQHMDHAARTAYSQEKANEMGEAGLFEAEIAAQKKL